jgi:hypothetical protein
LLGVDLRRELGFMGCYRVLVDVVVLHEFKYTLPV